MFFTIGTRGLVWRASATWTLDTGWKPMLHKRVRGRGNCPLGGLCTTSSPVWARCLHRGPEGVVSREPELCGLSFSIERLSRVFAASKRHCLLISSKL